MDSPTFWQKALEQEINAKLVSMKRMTEAQLYGEGLGTALRSETASLERSYEKSIKGHLPTASVVAASVVGSGIGLLSWRQKRMQEMGRG